MHDWLAETLLGTKPIKGWNGNCQKLMYAWSRSKLSQHFTERLLPGRQEALDRGSTPFFPAGVVEGLVDPSDVLPQTCVDLTRICLQANESDFVALLAFLRTQLIHTTK